MDQKTVTQLVEDYSDVVRRFFSVKKVILFGSYAGGTPRKHSDIDVAVVIDYIKGDYLDLSAQLFRLRSDIDCRIEPVLIEEGKDRSGFLSEILRTGKIIYDSETEQVNLADPATKEARDEE